MRRPEDPSLPAVPGPHDLDDFLIAAVGWLMGHRFVQGRVEGATARVDPLEPLALEGRYQRGSYLLDVLAATVSQGQVGRVENREELLRPSLGGSLEMLGLLLQDSLLVVLEVGLEAYEGVAILVPLEGHLDQRVRLRLDHFGLDEGLGGHVGRALGKGLSDRISRKFLAGGGTDG